VPGVGDRVVSSNAKTLPPEQRKMSMIFQSMVQFCLLTIADAGAEHDAAFFLAIAL
jgi:ABC-type Fe3+/spermidine/putrescine transport system ATPase subunit